MPAPKHLTKPEEISAWYKSIRAKVQTPGGAKNFSLLTKEEHLAISRKGGLNKANGKTNHPKKQS